MSITLSNGVVLPDIPSTIPEEYSFRAIVKVTASGGICVAATPSSLLMVPAAVSGSTYDMLFSEATSHYLCTLSEDGSTWGEAVLLNNAPGYNLSTQEIVWANHDILVVTSGSADGITVGTEIYFPSSVASAPPFVLPDGTELPALPEGCFEKHPYGVIAKGVSTADGSVTYLFTAATTERVFVPTDISGYPVDVCVSKENGYLSYEYSYGSADGWTEPGGQEDDGDIIPIGDGAVDLFGAVFYIEWSNHDILAATAKNDDAFEFGDLYRKSDVNYRIYGGWLNSMGNQARRLGNVSGELKPGEMETVMKGVTAGGGTSLAPNERIYQVGNAKSSRNMFDFECVATTQ